MALYLAIIPVCRVFGVMLAFFALLGVHMGVIDTVANSVLIKIHGKKVSQSFIAYSRDWTFKNHYQFTIRTVCVKLNWRLLVLLPEIHFRALEVCGHVWRGKTWRRGIEIKHIVSSKIPFGFSFPLPNFLIYMLPKVFSMLWAMERTHFTVYLLNWFVKEEGNWMDLDDFLPFGNSVHFVLLVI